MLLRARSNLASIGNPHNITFEHGQITAIPVASGTVDCVISNCVINLVPQEQKHLVFSEIARVLKPGGRVAISDTLAKKPFPPQLRQSIAAYVGCIAGCSPEEDYERYLMKNGFDGAYKTALPHFLCSADPRRHFDC